MQPQTYSPTPFTFSGLNGLSDKQLAAHLGLYQGYVKNANLLWSEVVRLQNENLDGNTHLISELQRRFGFEFNGMRLHEYYFGALGTTTPLAVDSPLRQRLAAQYGSFENWEMLFKKAGLMRGIGWVLLTYDKTVGALHNVWVADHEIGNLAGLPVIHAMDVWEHAYLLDYAPSERKQYIEAFWSNVNWAEVEKRFIEHK